MIEQKGKEANDNYYQINIRAITYQTYELLFITRASLVSPLVKRLARLIQDLYITNLILKYV